MRRPRSLGKRPSNSSRVRAATQTIPPPILATDARWRSSSPQVAPLALEAEADRKAERAGEDHDRTEAMRAVPHHPPRAIGRGMDYDRIIVAAVFPSAGIHHCGIAGRDFQ